MPSTAVTQARSENTFVDRYGPMALVTGASDGIGAAFCDELAANGFDLILTARRTDRLEALAAKIGEAHGVATHVLALDLSEPSSVEALIVFADEHDVGLLVNCAGFGTSGPLLSTSAAEEIAMVGVNCTASLTLTKALAPKMAARGSGGIVLMSSIVAFQGVPRSANYAATKSYIQSLAEALASELKPHGVDVLSVAPGPVRSGFAARAGMVMSSPQAPETVARGALAALGRTTTVRPGFMSKFLGHSLRMLPRSQRTLVMKSIMGGMTKHQGQRTGTPLSSAG
ncbi:MAG: SDR family oxidoreductase [Devosia sp.]